ncbi:hypothetical protein [Roseateles sp.]|uniref:hypothetical protein n=1 Tax=Roseateles sp. TaxID=1971397 RepID=UPI00286C55FE|nr:hypothetical protein [Roseateles sp.]
MNEYYVSHSIDLTLLEHASQGTLLVARQNLAHKGDKNPWAIIGSLRRGVSFATDGLPHEHGLLAVQDQRLSLAAGASATFGFFGSLLDDHPEATGDLDLAHVDALLRLPEASSPVFSDAPAGPMAPRSLFVTAPLLVSLDLNETELLQLFAGERRHEEQAQSGELLSFTQGLQSHVVLRAKELLVQRPHGHILRSAAGQRAGKALPCRRRFRHLAGG